MKRHCLIYLFIVILLGGYTAKLWGSARAHRFKQEKSRPAKAKTVQPPPSGAVKFRADIAYGLIGQDDKTHGDNAYDNVFHVRLPRLPRANEIAILQYELKGVTSQIAVPHSLNDGQSMGGYFVQPNRRWTSQKEAISALSLRKGDNVIRFGLTDNAAFHYEVRKLAVIYEKRKASDIIHLNGSNDGYFGDAGYISGVLSLPGKLFCNDRPIAVHRGGFEIFLNNPTPDHSGFAAKLELRLASGKRVVRMIRFKTNIATAYRFTPRETGVVSEGLYHPRLPFSLRSKHPISFASLTAPAGALPADTRISITALHDVDIAPLNSDMVNVTGFARAYRFLPHGSKFRKAVKLSIPYDAHLIPKGYTKADIRTFYFDEAERRWTMLPVDTAKTPDGMVAALTTHFTDMINGIIKVPESPQTTGYTPTSIKDYKAADPSAAIEMIAPPTANNAGSASLSYPIKLPKGRLGLQPNIDIRYSNEGANGWLGLGWNVAIPSIGIDTRWGAPRYDAASETETYTVSGEQLAPLANRTAFIPRVADKQFHIRVEGAFQKIIRHGTNPKNYWWEITNKNGVRSFYGGTPNSGLNTAAVLTDAAGNVAEWKLVQTLDLHGNNVNYLYAKVNDVGLTGGTVPGVQLYLSDIYYTGTGTANGPYHVELIRGNQLGEPKRTDVEISARLGFKMVTADLLRKINITYAGQAVRSYELKYRQGEFFKTLLQSISEMDSGGTIFNTHSFDYWDDIKTSSSTAYLGAAENWSPAADNVHGDFLTGIPGFTDEASALNSVKSGSAGGGLTVSVGLPDFLEAKSNTIGGNVGYDGGSNEGVITMVDINGDGLPDKVFKKGGTLFYRPNLGLAGHGFGNVRPVTGIGDFSVGSSQTVKWGVQLVIGNGSLGSGSLGYEHNNTTNKTTDYFADFNGDGLIDLASNGQVYFNHLNSSGDPVFTLASTLTPNPITPAGGIDKTLLAPDTALQHQQELQFPLQDAVRFWQAPFDGTVNITAPVQLQASGLSGVINPKQDGIRASIQLIGNVLWSTVIPANDYSLKVPSAVSGIPVKKGQRLYFRLQSNYNGDGDLVQWDPVITYQNPIQPLIDANNRASNFYQASRDFILDNKIGALMAEDGTVSINGTYNKNITSDSSTIVITRRHTGVNTVVFSQPYGFAQANGTINITGLSVNQGDTLFCTTQSRSYIDRTAISFAPHYVYTAFTNGAPAVNASGSSTLEGYIAPDNTNFNDWHVTANSYSTPYADTVYVKPVISGSTAATGTVTFSVKGINVLYGQKNLQLNAGNLAQTDSVRLIVKSNTPYFFEYAASDANLADALNTISVSVAKDTIVHIGGTIVPQHIERSFNANLYTNPSVNYLGSLFRGWGQFAYKGNQNNLPIDESKLSLNLAGTYPSNPATIVADTNVFKGLQNPALLDFTPMTADARRNLWVVSDTSVYVSSLTMSSSRLWLHDVSVDSLMVGASLTAVKKVNVSSSTNYSLGGSFGLVNAGAYKSTSDNSTKLDMMDMNGDRYPDVLSPSAVQYSIPAGGLEPSAHAPHNLGGSSSTGKATGASLGGESAKAADRNSGAENARAAQGDARASIGIGGSAGSNDQESNTVWVDVNGDGLPDKVYKSGAVALNLGYSFAPPENWGLGAIDQNKSTSLSANLGVNYIAGSFEAGFGISRATSKGIYTLADMNGDGLLDQVSANGVSLNYGNGFAPLVSWSALSAFSSSVSTGESLNAAYSFGFELLIPPIKVIFNPAIYAGHGFSREQDQITDIDGDGYPDILHSDNDGNLTVMRSTIGRTNMLRTVTRPMGAFFNIDYQRTNNSYEMPQNKWVMKNLVMFDGLAGDGADTMRTSFAYAGGHYNRREREFYGFDTVVTSQLNTAARNVVYRSNKRLYLNDSYYTKGLVQSEWLQDAAGNKYTQTDNLYNLRLVQDSVFFPALVQTTKSFYEGQNNLGARTSTQYNYDNLGNVILIDDAGDGSSQDDQLATVTYQNNPVLYIVGIPASVTVKTVDGTKRYRTTQINNFGDIISISQFQASGTASVYDLAYDTYGNLAKITRPANTSGQRMFYQYEYDPQVNTYVTNVSDAYGYSSSSSYEYLFGNALQTVDMHGEPMKFAYDNRGRMTTVTGPYEVVAGKPYTLRFEYFPDASVPYAITHHYDPEHNGDINIVTLMDGLGRAVQVKKQSSLFTGKNKADQLAMVVSGRVLYDAFGRAASNYYPITEPLAGSNNALNANLGNINSVTTFDVEDRPVKEVLADGATSQMAYTAAAGFLITNSTDALKNTKQLLTDVRGRKREEDLYGGPAGTIATKFNYDALDELTSVADNSGNTTSYTYDNLGRKLSVQHPDAGLTSFVYDDAGNMTQKITAQLKKDVPQGGAINYQYDFERLAGIDYPIQYQNKVTYKYGTPTMGDRAGRLILQEDASGGLEYYYGKLGEVTKQIRTVMVSQIFYTTYVSEQTYDTWNRVKSMVYPDGEKVDYHYNMGGDLQSIDGKKLGNPYSYVSQLGYDEYGQRVYLRYGNGTETDYSYDVQRRRLMTLQATTASGRLMMDNSYSYDAVSNILGITNNAKILAGKLGGSSKQTYGYDNLYRLTSAKGNYKGATNVTGSYALSMAYDNLYNITSKKLAEPEKGENYTLNYTYSARPHELSSIGSENYSYDLNGNQTGHGNRENFWDEENRLQAILDNGTLSLYTYDAGGERVVKSSGGVQGNWVNGAPAGTINHYDHYKVYVSPYLVCSDTSFTKHIYIESQRIVSQIGHGNFTNINYPTPAITAGGIDYIARAKSLEQQRISYYSTLGVPPGPPTNKLFYALPQNSHIAPPVLIDNTASSVPAGWPGGNNTTPPPIGPPIFVPPIPSNDSVKAGYGFNGTGHFYEDNQFFYHTDHLGSTAYITDLLGEVSQHVEYVPFGETYFEEHNANYQSPYLFNGKERDDETGLYYYGARYYDPKISVWVSVDPMADKYPGLGPYNYTLNNPVRLIDLDGRDPEENGGITQNSDLVYRGAPDLPLGHPLSPFDFLGGALLKGAGMLIGRFMALEAISGAEGLASEMLGATAESSSASVGANVLGEGINTEMTTVGRWMSKTEYAAMKNGSPVAVGAGNKTSVTIGGSDVWIAAKPGDVYVEFQVPANSLVQGGGRGIYSILGPNASRSQMFQLQKLGGEVSPSVQNISPVLRVK